MNIAIAEEIRKRIGEKEMDLKQAAAFYNMHPVSVRRIVERKTWAA